MSNAEKKLIDDFKAYLEYREQGADYIGYTYFDTNIKHVIAVAIVVCNVHVFKYTLYATGDTEINILTEGNVDIAGNNVKGWEEDMSWLK